MSDISKVNLGLGAALIVANAVFLREDSGTWHAHIGFILLGISLVLNGISVIRGGTGQKVIVGLGLGFAGVALVFFVVGLVTLRRS